MSQASLTQEGIVLTIPGTYVAQKVISGQSGLPTAGVIALVGEATEGPGFDQEADLGANIYGPDEFEAVVQKYGSGRLVDAYRAIVAPASDPVIVGAPSAIYLVKTNSSSKAQAALGRAGLTSYALLSALRGGASGNLIRYKSEASQAEFPPVISMKTYTPLLNGTATGSIKINGGSSHSFNLPAFSDMETFASTIGNIDQGVVVNGGATVNVLTGKGTIPTPVIITATVQGTGASSTLKISLPAGQVFGQFSNEGIINQPVIGSTAVIPAAGQYGATPSVIKGSGPTSTANVGSYIITAVNNTLSNAFIILKPVNVANPAALENVSGSVSAGEQDVIVWEQVSIYNISGTQRPVFSGTADWSATVNGSGTITVSFTGVFTAKPQIGDFLKFSALWSGVTAGYYVVTGSTSNSVSFFRISYGAAGGSGSVSSSLIGFVVLKPDIDGLGKTLETYGDWNSFLKNIDGSNSAASPAFYTSASEYINKMTILKETVSNEILAGGNIAIKVGCTDQVASVTVTPTSVVLSDGTGTQEIDLNNIVTLSDLVAVINSRSAWTASVASNKYSFLSAKTLDSGVFGASTFSNNQPARIKRDAADWSSQLAGSTFVSTEVTALAGLPEVSSTFAFLSGGARGATTGASVVAALDAVKDISTNFIVPLFSVDATDDAATGETDSLSTYTIDAINAAVKANVISSSAVKARANRQGFLSKQASFPDQQEAAGDISSFRCSMSFLNIKALSSSGSISSYQPWMCAVIAAGMQAAAGYRGIVKKFANVTGLFHAAGDYNPRSYSQKETALKAGLLPVEPVNTGGFRFVSDQTTYSLDANFVFNSVQAVYIADLMTLSLIDSFDRVIVGQSVAEVSASAALSFLEGQMFNFYRLKWITTSNDAPLGYKNASVKIQGGTMYVTVEAKLAGLIYFVPITLSISEVTQEAVQ